MSGSSEFSPLKSSQMSAELKVNDILPAKVSYRPFYDQYHGHPHQSLQKIVDEFRSKNRSLIFFAGDSTLDNKYWFSDTREACNGYEVCTITQHKKSILPSNKKSISQSCGRHG